jgi:hypothetical protein
MPDIEACTGCGHWRIAYNGCRNRHCPKCQGAAERTWLAEAALLPVGYFHVAFTLPAQIAFRTRRWSRLWHIDVVGGVHPISFHRTCSGI